MIAASIAALGPVAAAGSPKHFLPPIKHTILNRVRITDAAQIPKVGTGTGVVTTDSSGTLWGGQTSHARFTGHGTTGTFFGTTLSTPWNFTTSYPRFVARVNNYTYGKQFIFGLAKTKADYQAGNYIRYGSKPSPTSGGVANWFATNTWVYDGCAPALMATLGSGTDLTNIGYIVVSPADTNSSNSTVWDLAEIQNIQSVGMKAKCVIWHDDSVPSGAAAMYSRLQTYGWAASEATEWESIPNTTGASGAFPVATYRSSGWTMATHAVQPSEHTDVSSDSVTNQSYRAKLQDYRFGANGESGDFTYWGGLKAANAYEPVRMFYRSGRWNTSGLTYPDMQPAADPSLMKAILVGASETFTTNWQPLLTNAITVKGIAQFVFHQDVSTNTPFATEFDSMLSWLDQNRANIDVVTLPQALLASTQ